MKLYNVQISLTENGWKDVAREYEVKETEKTYSFPGTRIDKSKIMAIETNWRDSHRYYNYETWCLLDDLKKANAMLVNAIKEKAELAKVVCDKIHELSLLEP